MAHLFKNNSGKNTFRQFVEPDSAGNYIIQKKIKAAYCLPNCDNSFKALSQSNLLMLKTSYNNDIYSCFNSINKKDLYINLITKLDLSCDSDVIPIVDTSGNLVPAIINSNGTTYTRYDIDPYGKLFGNTTCGLNNFVNYLVYNPPCENNIIN